jgi:hypothetical protein
MSVTPISDPVDLARENEQLRQLLVLKEQELATARDWFDAFQQVDSWLLEQGLWGEEDIHEKNPAQTLITGLARNLALRDAQALDHCRNLLAGLVARGGLVTNGEEDLGQLLEQARRQTLAGAIPTQAQAFVAFARARRAYEKWLRATPAEEFAPATHDEVMALYDQSCSPALPANAPQEPMPADTLRPEVVSEVVAQCQAVLTELAAREERNANGSGKRLLVEAAAELEKING